jgi:Spy/CpxP family protein refolding chaperone
MSPGRTVTCALVLTVIVAALGGWLGVRYGLRQASAMPGLDQVLHHELTLSADQQQQLASLEAGFAARRKVLEAEMQAANRDLATAIVSEHRYGPAAEQAINRFHSAMKTLQQETIMHVLAMRAILTPDQARIFDQTVSKVLNSDPS